MSDANRKPTISEIESRMHENLTIHPDGTVTSENEDLKSRIAELEAEVKRLKLVGQKMSNLCYNGRQLDRIPKDYRETMGKLYKEWDEAIHHTESEDKG